MRVLFALAMVLLATLVSLPSASAILVSTHSFGTELGAFSLGDANATSGAGGLPSNMTLLTGSANWTSRGQAFGFANVSSVSSNALETIEAFNRTELGLALGERRFPQTGAHQAFNGDPQFVIGAGSTVLLVARDATPDYTCESPFFLGFPIVVPPEIFGPEALGISTGAFLLSSSNEQDCTLSYQIPTANTYLILATDQSSVTVTDSSGVVSFQGTDWIFRMQGLPTIDVAAMGILSPFSDHGTGTLRPYGGSDLGDRFDLDLLTGLVSAFSPQEEGADSGGGDADGNQSLLPPDVTQALESMAPVLNGVIFGGLGSPTMVEGTEFRGPGFAFIRFTQLELATDSNNSSAISVNGFSRFILVGDSLYATQSASRLGPFTVPALSIVLWIIAAAAIVAGFVIKPFVGADQVKAFGLIRLLGWIFHLLAIVVSFLLWDLEFQALLGTSLLEMFLTEGTSSPVALGIISAFEIIPYSMALLFFGMPLRFITNTALKLGGIKKGRGLGKGVGNLAQWGIGAAFIPLLLQGFVTAVLSALSNVPTGPG